MHDTNEANQPDLIAEISNNIGRLVLNNEGKHNALTLAMWEALPEALDGLVGQGARVIVIEGAGRSFCAGADISEFSRVRRDDQSARVYETSNSDAFASVGDVSVPVIAKIRGFCLGGGFGIAAACDIRIASDDSTFAVPAARLGLAYPVDAMADIVNAVGAQNAKRLLYTAERFSADAMLQMGFLSQVTSSDDLDAVVGDLADRIAGLAPLTHRASKAAIAASLGGDRDRAVNLGDATFTSDDYVEGRAAFAEKRPPRFSGN